MLYYSVWLIIGQDQYDTYNQRSQRVQSNVSPNVNQDLYRQQQQQQHQGFFLEDTW